jgi:hypothetical protein
LPRFTLMDIGQEALNEIPSDLALAYSEGRIARRDIAIRLNRPVSFGELLHALHTESLPLPRFPASPDAVAIVRDLATRAAAHG